MPQPTNDLLDNEYAEHRLGMYRQEASLLSPEGYPWGETKTSPQQAAGYGKDIAKSIPWGIAQATTNAADSLAALAASLDLHGTAEAPFEHGQLSEHVEGEMQNPLESLAPETLPGALTGGIAQFLTGFLPFLKIFRALGAPGIIGEWGAGMIADATVFKPFEDNLANLVDKLPAEIKSPTLAYLAKPVRAIGEALKIETDDTRAEATLKRMAEGMMMATFVDPFIHCLRVIKASGAGPRIAKKVGKEVVDQTGLSFMEHGAKAHEVHMNTGGATYNLRTGESMAGRDEYVLSLYPERQVVVPGQANSGMFSSYMEMNKDLLLGADQRINFGSWLNDKGDTVFDVSATVPREHIESVHALGREFDQEAAWDLFLGEEIPLAGTGKGRPSDIPEAERLATVPTTETGTVKLQRYMGKTGITEVDPTKKEFYTGVSGPTGPTRRRAEGVLGEETPHRLMYYTEGAVHEPHVMQGRTLYETEIPKGRLYNALMDPLGLRAKATPGPMFSPELKGKVMGMQRPDANTYERLMKEAGYAGYIDPRTGYAAVWEKLPVREVQRKLPLVQAAKATLKSQAGFVELDWKPGKVMGPQKLKRYGYEGAAQLAISNEGFEKWVKDAAAMVGEENAAALRKSATDTFEKMLNKAPSFMVRTKRMLEFFEKGKHLQDWYHPVRPEVEMIFGDDADMVVKFLAATSGRATSKANITMGMKAYKQWVLAGRPKNMDFDGFVRGHLRNLERATKGEAPQGRKVINFEKALNGDPEAVVLDRWMLRGLGFDTGKGIDEHQYEMFETIFRDQARKAGVPPADFQAGVWVGIKTVEGRPQDVVDSWGTMIREWLDANPKWVEELDLNYRPDGTAGFTKSDLTRVMARIAVGGVAGGAFGDTPEDRIRNAAIGMGITGLAPSAIKKMSSLIRSARPGEVVEEAAEGLPGARKGVPSPEAATWDEMVGMHRVPDEVQATWDEFNALVDTFDWRTVKAKRGEVRPREMAHLEGEFLGWTIDDVKKMTGTFNLSDEQASALINVMKDAGDATIHAARKWLETESPDDLQNFLRLYNTFLEMDPKRFAAKAEAGRSLGILNDPLSGYNKYLDQFASTAEYGTHVGPSRLAQMVAALENPEQLARAFHRGMRPKMGDVLLELWINGLLSGPTTHAVNFLGNASVALWSIPERAIASRIGRGVHKGEATAMMFGMMHSVMDAWKLAQRAFKEGAPIHGLQKIETKYRKAIGSEAFGMEGGIWASFIDYMGEAIRLPGRFLLAGDEFGKCINARAQTYALAYREGMGKGLKGKQFAEYVKANLDNMPSRIRQQADEWAAVQTFTNELGGFGEALTSLSQSSGFARIIMPFVKTPVNIFKYVTERLPMTAPFYKQVRADIRAGGVARDMALAKMSTGAISMAMFGTLAAMGFVTGRAPKNRVLRQAWEADGKREYSILTPWGDWVSFNRFDPLGMIMGLAADFVTGFQQSEKEDYTEFAEDMAATLVAGFARNLTSKTYMRGVAEAVEAITSEEPDKVRKWARQFTGSWIPSIVAQTAREIDPVMRESHTIMDKWLSRTPWLSKEVPPRRNIFGEVQKYTGALGPDWISPFYSSPKKDPDPIMKEIAKNETEVAMPPRSIAGVSITAKERDAWITEMNKVEIEGMNLKERLRDLINSYEYKEATEGPDGMKSEMIKDVIYTYKKAGLLQLRDKDDNLDRRLREQEAEVLEAKWGEEFDVEEYMEAIR